MDVPLLKSQNPLGRLWLVLWLYGRITTVQNDKYILGLMRIWNNLVSSTFVNKVSWLPSIFGENATTFRQTGWVKVHIFWECHKILRNLHLTFVLKLSSIKGHNSLFYFLFSGRFRKCLILLPAFNLIMWLMKLP